MQKLFEVGYYNRTNDDFHYEQMYFQSEAEAKQWAKESCKEDDEVLNVVQLSW